MSTLMFKEMEELANDGLSLKWPYRIKAGAMPVFLPPVHGLLRWPPSVLSKGTALGSFANTASRHQRDPSNALSIHSAYKQQNKTTPNS